MGFFNVYTLISVQFYYLIVSHIFVPYLYLGRIFVPICTLILFLGEMIGHFDTLYDTIIHFNTKMSSNIRIQKICQQCGNEFTARTTVTQYCSDTCSKRAYKSRLRNAKIEKASKETQQMKDKPILDLKAREFLTVRQVAKVIGCSRQTAYNLINAGKLRAVNILEKKTIVKRADLDLLFEQARPVKHEPELMEYDISDCYTLNEIQNKYSISQAGLQKIIKRNHITKIRNGRFAYVPKLIIDKILN